MTLEKTRRHGQNQQLPGHHLSKPALLLRIIILQMLRRERYHPTDVWLLLLLQNQSVLSLRPEPLERNTGILQGVEKWEKWRHVLLLLIISFPLSLNIYLFTYLFIDCTHVRVGVGVIWHAHKGCVEAGDNLAVLLLYHERPRDNASLLTQPSRWPSLIFPIGVTDYCFIRLASSRGPLKQQGI